MRKSLFIFVALVIGMGLLGLMIPIAQSDWSIWVYQAETGRLLHVGQDGSVSSTLDIRAEEGMPPVQKLLISPDGNTLAYMESAQRIILKDLNTGTEIAQIGLSDIGIPVSPDDRLLLDNAAFGERNNSLVYGEILGGFGWQIHVFDLSTKSISHTLHFNDALSSNYPVLHAGIFPKIQNVHGDTITFTTDPQIPVGIHTYHWFYEAGILSETVASPSLNAVAFPYSGDIVNPVYDANFQATNEDFRYDFLQRNALHAYVLADGRFPFFVDPALDFEKVWFIQAGERLLTQAYVDEIRRVWIIIERDGTELRRQPVAGTDIFATPDGFVYVTPVESQTAIVEVNTRSLANAGETVWVQPGQWRIVWAGVNRPQSAFTAWTKLANVQADPSGLPAPDATPTLAPAPNDFRKIGMPIQVYVPDAGYLNLRDAPSTNSNVLTLLESGSRGEIVDGPVDAEGFIWWQIVVDGRTGWVVEALPDSLSLIPPQLIITRTPTPSPTP